MNSWTLFIIGLLFIPYANLKLRFVVLKTPVCDKYSRDYLRNFSMDLHDNMLDVDVDLVKLLQSGLRLHMDFSTRRIRATSFSRFYEYSLDMCSMLATRKNNIFKRWFSTFFAYGNLQKTCPVLPNYYYLKNYKINDLEIPPFLFAGLFRLEFTMTQNNGHPKQKDFIFSCDIEIEIK